jgi:hypothetical protein
MKLTNTKIKKLIRESLRRILFESEDRIEDLKDQFNLIYQKMSRAKSQEEFDQLNAEAERLDKEINRLTKTMFKEPDDPGEFDFMETEPLQPPMLSRGTEVGSFQDEIDPLDKPAMIDVSDGEGNEFSGGPMTQRDMNRREFMQNLGVGIGASAMLGKQILDSDSLFADPRLQIASDWFDQSFADGTWDSFIYNRYISSNEFSSHLFPNFDSLPIDEQKALIADYVIDYAPEEWGEGIGTEFENAGYQDPGETGEMDVYNQLKDLIYRKINKYYTPEKIKQLRSAGATKTIPLTNDMIEAATEGYADEHFDYNGATDVISTGTLDDIELFENNQAVRIAVDYMDAEGLNLSKADSHKLLNAIRAKIDKIMSRLGGP